MRPYCQPAYDNNVLSWLSSDVHSVRKNCLRLVNTWISRKEVPIRMFFFVSREMVSYFEIDLLFDWIRSISRSTLLDLGLDPVDGICSGGSKGGSQGSRDPPSGKNWGSQPDRDPPLFAPNDFFVAPFNYCLCSPRLLTKKNNLFLLTIDMSVSRKCPASD